MLVRGRVGDDAGGGADAVLCFALRSEAPDGGAAPSRLSLFVTDWTHDGVLAAATFALDDVMYQLARRRCFSSRVARA